VHALVQSQPEYISDERARQRAEEARQEYRERLKELKDQIQEAVVRTHSDSEHSVSLCR